MKDDMGTFNHTDNDVTYVEGLGFIPQNNNRPSQNKIRMMANVICIILLLYYPSKHFLFLPITHLLYLLGLNITINDVTGSIILSQESKLIVQLCVNMISLLILLLLFYVCFHRAYVSAHIFRRPNSGIAAIAVPMIAAGGLLSVLAAYFFDKFTKLFGIVFDVFPGKISDFSLLTGLSLLGTLIIAILQEILFRGIVLTPLRKFGDDFAITLSAILFPICTENPISAVMAFPFGIVAGYFTIRSGSIYVPILGRILLEFILFGFRAADGMLNPLIKSIIIPAVCIIVFVLGLLAYKRFIKADKNAFKLFDSCNQLSNSKKIGTFCTSFGFLILVILMISRIINTIQIIG